MSEPQSFDQMTYLKNFEVTGSFTFRKDLVQAYNSLKDSKFAWWQSYGVKNLTPLMGLTEEGCQRLIFDKPKGDHFFL
jgi:hypothetical protein